MIDVESEEAEDYQTVLFNDETHTYEGVIVRRSFSGQWYTDLIPTSASP